MMEIQGKSILVRVSEGSSYRESTVGFFGSNYTRVVLVDIAAFKHSNDDCSSSVHCHFTPSQVGSQRDLMNLEQNAAQLRRLLTSDTLINGATFWRASTFLGSGDFREDKEKHSGNSKLTLREVYCQTTVLELTEHLSHMSVIIVFVCAPNVDVVPDILDTGYAMDCIPAFFWKIAAHERPKLRCLYWNSPCVENLLSGLKSGRNGIWWFSWFKSILQKTLQLFRSDTVIDDDGYDVALPDEGFV